MKVNTSQQKKPLPFIGLIAFLAIAVVGMLYDFVVRAKGKVAIPAVAAAVVILGVILVVDAIIRKRAQAGEADPDPFGEDESDEDRQFLRHTAEKPEEELPFSWNTDGDVHPAFAGFRRHGADDVQPADGFEQASFEDMTADSFDDDLDVANEPEQIEYAPGGEQLPEVDDVTDDEVYSFDEDVQDDITDAADDSAAQYDEPVQEDDPFRPVLRLDGQTEQPAEEITEEPVQEEIEEPEAEEIAEPEPEPVPEPRPRPKQVRPAPKAERAAVPAASAAASGGQTIESFYNEMSDEDILYRDCVEVWAADAKPAALRLIKYVEGIEDKQTAALIGREVEYVNAMIDRINCFTQLEYIDELLEYKEHNYSTLVKDCLKRFSPFFMEKRLGLLWKGLDINVLTDRRWFIFALTQVIFNAVEFTPNGGKIAISAKKYENYIDLTVEDSGKGIAAEELPFIFMAGYMGDDAPNESGRRTGMGLFIAQSVMRKMGGDMLAESVQGKGTRITLRMPIIDPMA